MTNLEQTRQAWEAYAEGYDRALTATDMRAAEEALRLAGVRAGTRLLDIAAGPGALSIPAARLGANVVAVDYSHAMVSLLERKARYLSLSNLHVRLMDGMALEFEDESFDVACSSLGIMLFPDRARGLREMARVVAAGGRGVMVVLGPPDRVTAVSAFFEAMTGTLSGFTPPRESPLFCLADRGVLRREMEHAGFRDVRAEPFENTLDVESPDDLWNTLMAGAPAIGGLMQSLSEPAQRSARRALVAIVRSRFGASGPVRFPMTFNLAVGTKPDRPPTA